MKFTASRLSEGNKVFPAEISIDDHGVTVRIPGVFGGESTHLDFQNIGNVHISTPSVGYSTITFHASGSQATAHGFTAGEARQIKRAIDDGRNALSDRHGGRDRGRDEDREYDAWKMRREQEHEREMAKLRAREQLGGVGGAEVSRLREELEQAQEELRLEREKRALEEYLHPSRDDKNFRSREAIANIQFPPFADEIERTVERIVRAAIDQVQEAMERRHITMMQHQLHDIEFWRPYNEEFKFAEAALAKAREGLRKLKRVAADDDAEDRMRIDDLSELIATLENTWIPALGKHRIKKRRKNIAVVLGVLLAFAGMMALGLMNSGK